MYATPTRPTGARSERDPEQLLELGAELLGGQLAGGDVDQLAAPVVEGVDRHGVADLVGVVEGGAARPDVAAQGDAGLGQAGAPGEGDAGRGRDLLGVDGHEGHL